MPPTTCGGAYHSQHRQQSKRQQQRYLVQGLSYGLRSRRHDQSPRYRLGLSANTNSGMVSYIQYGCNMCHSSGYSTAVLRPVRAQDVHGVNVLPTSGLQKSVRWAGNSTGSPSRVDARPYAFIRNTQVMSDHSPKTISGSTYTPNCNMASGSPINCNQSVKSYSVGGTY